MAKDLALQQQKAVALRDYMQGDQIKSQLAAALPKWLSADRLLRIVFTSVMKNPKLIECTRESILSSVMQCAQLGLEPILGRAYLIPYDNKKYINGSWIKVPECQMQIGYQGLVDLARRTDTIADVWGANVYENDDFRIQYGMDRSLHHVPWFMDPEKRKSGESGEVIGAYVVWKLKDGTMHPEFMPIIDILKRRARSQSYAWAETGNPKQGGGKRNSVWHEWPEEMNLKTVIKHSSKLVPASIEFMQAIEIDDAADSGLSTIGYFEDQITLPESMPAKQIETQPDQIDSQSNPVENIQNENIKSQFSATFGDYENDIQLKEFLSGTARMNGTMIVDIMKSAIGDVDEFKSAFDNWKSKLKPAAGSATDHGHRQTTRENKNGSGVSEWSDFVKSWVRLHGTNFKKFVSENLNDFKRAPDWVLEKAQKKYEDKVNEPWPSKLDSDSQMTNRADKTEPAEGQSTGQAENGQSGANHEVDITQTDEWNEISMLQERYPDIYSRVAKGRPLKTVDDLNALITDITDAVDLDEVESSQHGQTGAFDSQSGDDDDIPY